jgi:hypothetical protein
VGEAAVALGAGRAKKSDPIDHAVGFVIHKKVGDDIEKGESLFTIHANDEQKLAEAREAGLAAHSFSDVPGFCLSAARPPSCPGYAGTRRPVIVMIHSMNQGQ